MRFRLQPVLGYKAEIEKLRKLEFAAAKRDLHAAEDALQQHEAEAEASHAEYTCALAAPVSAAEIQLYGTFLQRKADEIRAQRGEVAEKEQAVAERGAELVVAAKEKKALEKLKEKQKKALSLEWEAKERRFLEERTAQARPERR